MRLYNGCPSRGHFIRMPAQCVRRWHNNILYSHLGLLFVSLFFGIAANSAKGKGEAFKTFFGSFGEVVMLLMQKFLL